LRSTSSDIPFGYPHTIVLKQHRVLPINLPEADKYLPCPVSGESIFQRISHQLINDNAARDSGIHSHKDVVHIDLEADVP
jgi:hypothetical protein